MTNLVRVLKVLWTVLGAAGVAISAVLGYMTERQRGILFEQLSNRTLHIVSQDILAVSGTADIHARDRKALVGLPFDKRASQDVPLENLPPDATAIKVVKVESNEALSTLDLAPSNLQVEAEIEPTHPRSVHVFGRAVKEGDATRHLRVFVKYTPGLPVAK